MKFWELNRISGATPEIRDYCRQLFFFFTKTTDPGYFSVGPRGGKTPGTYRRFHNAIQDFSKKHPDDAITLQYTFNNGPHTPAEIQTIEYKNGISRILSTSYERE